MAKGRKDPKTGKVLKAGESYRKSDDSYVYRWTAANGERKAIYAKNLKTLREREEELQKDIYDGIRVEESRITVNDVYKLWKRDKKGLKDHTMSNYTYTYEHYVQNSFGEKRIQQIRRSDARKFYNEMLDDIGVAMTTLDNIHTVLNQVFNIAVEDRYIRTNPVSELMGEVKRARKYQATKRRSLTVQQQKAFLNFIAKKPEYKHWLPLFTFFLGTGCRVGEIVGLRWEDVDIEKGVIDINHSMSYYQREDKKCMYAISAPKTKAGTRTIPMLAEVKQSLLDEKKYQEDLGMECKANIDGYTDFIFLNRYGLNHNPQSINRTIKRIVTAYNEFELDASDKENREPLLIPNFSCHNLRHTFATRICENETNLKVIQEIMGHKNISTTMDVYAEATEEAKEKSFSNLAGKIF